MSISFYPLVGAGGGASGTDRTGTNWSFEDNTSALYTWTPDSLSWQRAGQSNGTTGSLVPYHGANIATFDSYVARVTTGVMTNDDTFTTSVGAVWTSTCRVKVIPGYNGIIWGRIGVKFLDAGNGVLQTSPGSMVNTGDSDLQIHTISTVTATAPATTAKVKLYLEATNTDTSYVGRVCFDWCTLHG